MFRRFCVIKVRTNEDIWLRWATKKGINEKVRGFVAQHPNMLCKDEKFDLVLEHTPDQYAMLSDYMDMGVIPDDPKIFEEVAIGFLGNIAAVGLIKWIAEEYKRPVRGIDVLDNYDAIADKLKTQKVPEYHVTLTELSAEMFVNDTPTPARVENIIKFLQGSPAEIIATFMSKLPPAYCKVLVSRREVTSITAKMVRSSNS